LSDTLLPITEVISKIGLSKSTLWKQVKAKEFPQPVKIAGATRWSENEIDDWIEAKKASR
jgi:prophage regulatory protein